MKMIRKLFMLVLLPLLLALPLSAVNARNYQDALRKGASRPVVLFCYGANYDKVSEKTYELFIKKRKIMPYVRSCAFLEVPVYQLPDEKEKKEFNKIMGGSSLPGRIWSYPCLVLMDGGGNVRGIVQSAEEMESPEAAGEALKAMLEEYEEQEKLLKKALRAGAGRQAKLLAQAADMKLDVPASHFSNIKKDTIGLGARFKYNSLSLVQKLGSMSLAQANSYIRNMIANGCYSRRQRQEMLAALAGHVRRNKGSVNRLRALYTEMRNIDPTSIYGAYAEGAIERWVLPMEKEGTDASK